jgi:hypothetical protein
MGFRLPSAPTPTAGERELLLGYARWQREQVVATTIGLTEEELRWTPDGQLLPIIGIVNHLAHMEWRWIEGRYLGVAFPPREQEWQVSFDRTGRQVIDAYWAQAQRTEEIVRAAPTLDAPGLGDEAGRGPAHVLLGFAEPITIVGAPPPNRGDRTPCWARGLHPGAARRDSDAPLTGQRGEGGVWFQ